MFLIILSTPSLFDELINLINLVFNLVGGLVKEMKPRGVPVACKNPRTSRGTILDGQAPFIEPSFWIGTIYTLDPSD